jgi:hypothetical protein
VSAIAAGYADRRGEPVHAGLGLAKTDRLLTLEPGGTVREAKRCAGQQVADVHPKPPELRTHPRDENKFFYSQKMLLIQSH